MNCTWKHQYSEKHIAEAEQIIGHIVAHDNEASVIRFDHDGKYTTAETGRSYYALGARYGEAKCSDDDCFNICIGRMVALCKATGTRLPDWI